MPVSYWQPSGDEIVCLTSATWSRWWANLDATDLLIVLRRMKRTGHSTLVADPVLRRRLVSGFLHHNADDAHHYGVELDSHGELMTDDLEQLADSPHTKVISIALESN
jgi:hypothetical protein